MIALLVPYGLFPLAVASALFNLGWNGKAKTIIPLAMGLGPFLYAWLLEVMLWLRPPTDYGMALVVSLGLAAALASAALEARGLRYSWLRREWSWVTLATGAAMLCLLWLASGPLILLTWDPQANRMIADRIVADMLVDPVALIFEPTVNDLRLIHAYHGLRYLLLLATNRLLADTDSLPAGWDALPAQWYAVSAILLVGGMIAKERGWHDWRPWAVGTLLVSAIDFLIWPLAGKEGGSFSAFACVAVYLTSMRAAEEVRCVRASVLSWLVAGATFGLVAGAHRTIILLGLVPASFAIARSLSIRHWAPMIQAAGAAVVAAIVFCPFGYVLTFQVGDWGSANPVSDALVPYRETFREAFEGNPLALGVVQFTAISKGALIWWSALAGAVVLWLGAQRDRRWTPNRAPLQWAFGISLFALSVMISDMAQIFRLTGFSELILRSTKYRQMVVPMLAYVGVTGVSRILRPAELFCSRWATERGALYVTVVGAGVFFSVLLNTIGYRLPQSLSALSNRLHESFVATDRENVERYSSGDSAIILAHVRNGCHDADRVYVDWMPLVPQIDCKVSNPWMPPGLFPLMETRDPERAWSVTSELDLRYMIMRPGRTDMEIYSATGLRLFQSIRTSSLVHDGRFLQLFERRANFLADPETLDADYTEQFRAMLSAQMPVKQSLVRVLETPIEGPGDFEIEVEFDSRGSTLVFAEWRNDVRKRTFRLKSYAPYVPGPQRFRFRLADGESANFDVQATDARIPIRLAHFSILSAPIAGDGH